MSHTLSAAGFFHSSAATRLRGIFRAALLTDKKAYLRNIHCPADMPLLRSYLLPHLRPGPTPSGIACSVCTVDLASLFECNAVQREFLVTIQNPIRRTQFCMALNSYNFFMIVRSYTTDYGLVKINMINFINYFSIFT